MAIIQDKTLNTWKWENLPTEYRESPFLTLDIDILFKPFDHILEEVDNNQTSFDNSQQSCRIQTSITNNERQADDITTETRTAEIPKPVFPKRTAVTRCCDLLSRVKNLIYECTNSTSLANLEKIFCQHLGNSRAVVIMMQV